uniref:RNA helicase n=1 Tax=Eptatretus burgeri TaxID=7764 RepID=A0A8C4Q651_EPTBU
MSANNQSGGQLVLAGDPKQLEPILKSFTAVKYVLVKRRVLFLATLKRTIKQLDEHSSVLSTQASTQASTPMERLAWFVEYCVFNGATTGDLQGCWSSSIREQEADMVDLLNKMKEMVRSMRNRMRRLPTRQKKKTNLADRNPHKRKEVFVGIRTFLPSVPNLNLAQ